ncbi:hypothetical protein [Falsirhodobacter sp. 20TX0035]|uniref:hypothetical protein n=1 Tax=Falsirhodobacter sp. 20TX0035 TaxID=3022019 RepID=UPI002330FCCD|nr:hypothetical protein [Falsirhodobacter sp. 20TX0035]MDB6452373.1 hypothetical protein [Falsirhodobacter sp. 20TX0035]
MRAAALLLLAVAACGPIPREDAEAACFRRAELALHPRGYVEIGTGSGGHTYTGVEINASSDFFMGRDPAAVYQTCVYNKSGEMPTRPLYERPDWRG